MIGSGQASTEKPSTHRTGLDGLLAATHAAVAAAGAGRFAAQDVIARLSEDFAFIRLQDLRRPRRFLRQMAGAPPVRVGATGFDPALVDDLHPARHYMAFVFVGYWFPAVVAILLLWAWEVAGFIRYRGAWSWPDVRMGYVGIRHGRYVRYFGAGILPWLMARDLAAPDGGGPSSRAG